MNNLMTTQDLGYDPSDWRRLTTELRTVLGDLLGDHLYEQRRALAGVKTAMGWRCGGALQLATSGALPASLRLADVTS